MIVRKMEASDVEAVARNEALCFSMPWSENAFREIASAQEAGEEQESAGIQATDGGLTILYLVAELDGRIVGHCGVRNLLGEGEITNVAVHPDYRNRGIASAMLTELLDRGGRMGIEAFTLEVRASNGSAVHLYEKAGFVTEGVRKGFYDMPKEDALIMWKR